MPATIDTYNALSDKELWGLLNGTDRRRALSVLYQRHYELLYNYGMKCCGDEELVKDCIQDVFVKLHQGKVLAPEVTVRAYLLRAFHNAFLDQQQVNGRYQDVFLEDDLQIPDSKDFFEDSFALSDEDIRYAKMLRDAIRSLSPNQKRLLYLHYVRKLSYKEIADAMGISVQSSMNLNNRALTKLKSILPPKTFLLWMCVWLMLDS